MLLHLRAAVEPATRSEITAMSFAAAPRGRPTTSTVSDMNFGQLESGDSYGSSATRIKSILTLPSFSKVRQ